MMLYFEKRIEDEKLIEKFTSYYKIAYTNQKAGEWDWRGASLLTYDTGKISKYFAQEFKDALPKEYEFLGAGFKKFLNTPQAATVVFGRSYVDHGAYSVNTNTKNLQANPIQYPWGGSKEAEFYSNFTQDDFTTKKGETVMVPKKRKSKREVAVAKRWEKRHPFIIQGQVNFIRNDVDPKEMYTILESLNYVVNIYVPEQGNQDTNEQMQNLESQIHTLTAKIEVLTNSLMEENK